MPVESWLNQEDVPDLAARATAMVDAALTGSSLTRDSFWAAVRKGYNTPYNDPPRRQAAPAQPDLIATPLVAADAPVSVPAAVIAAVTAEARAI
jgi:hypothetical protein